MEIYIEDAIIQNIVINYTLLSISEKAVLQKSKFWKKILASIIGTLFAILITFFKLNAFFEIIIKLLSGLVMALIIIDKFVFKKFLLLFIVFISSTFLMGGLIIAMEYLFNVSINGLMSAGIILLFYFILKGVIKQFYIKRKLNKFYYNLLLTNGEKTLDIKAYLDSGNLLQDDETGLSILVINYSTFSKLFDNKVSVMDYLQKKLDKKIKGKYISFSTVGGVSKMFVCNIDKVMTYEKGEEKKEIHVLLGIGTKCFKSNDCDALLSPLAL